METSENVEAAVLGLEERRCQAIGDHDWAMLEELLDESLVWIHMSGRVEDKATFLQRARLRDERIDREDVSVQVLGDDVVIMTGGIVVTPILNGAAVDELRASALQVWVHRESGWKMTAISLSRIALTV